MQTTLDRILRLKFGTRWIVNTMSLPRFVPAGVTIESVQVKAASSGVFSFRLTTDSEDAYHSAVAALRASKSLFNATVVERPGLMARLVNAPGSRFYDACWLSAFILPLCGLSLLLR